LATIQKTLARAIVHHQEGRLPEAGQLYQQILARNPRHPEVLNLLGVLAWQQGHNQEAIRWVQEAIAIDGQAADYHSNLGLFLHGLGRMEEALAALDRAVALNPHHPQAGFHRGNTFHSLKRYLEAADSFRGYLEANPQSAEAQNNLANALLAAGSTEEAATHFEKALQLRRNYPEAWNNFGMALRALGHSAEAEKCFRSSLEQKPGFAPALGNLAELLQQSNRKDEVVDLCRLLLQQNPACHETWNNLGNALQSLAELEQARDAYERSLSLHPDYFPAHSNRGNVLFRMGRYEEALASHQKALSLEPHSVEALNNAAVVLRSLNREPEAARLFERALRLVPSHPHTLTNFANLHRDQGRTEDAIALLRRAVDRHPGVATSWNSLGACLSEQGEVAQAIGCFERAMQLDPAYHQAHSNLLLNLHYIPYDPAELFQRHIEFGRAHRSSRGFNFFNTRDPERPIRIGYLSADFRRHSVAWFLEPVLAAHNRASFELYCYSTVRRPDEVTARFREIAGAGWRDASGLSCSLLAESIHGDSIDLLVDLGGHTADNNLLVLAQKPSPIQFNWLGYANTTGLTSVDYRITDSWADPPGATDSWHTETLLRLPCGFSCYQPPAEAPSVTALPSQSGNPFTFVSFNNFAKVHEPVLDVWAAILARLPGSRLLLKSRGVSGQGTVQKVRSRMACHGIDPSRIFFSGLLDRMSDHLACYDSADIALDTFPYNGTTTTCESLWMGVPVVTLSGSHHASRVGVSLLSRLGLQDWIAPSPDDYVLLAVTKATNSAALTELRATLRDRMRASSITDAASFTAALERAYRDAWRRWCAQFPKGNTPVREI